MLDIFTYCKTLREDQVILSHSGALDGEMIDIILQLADKRLVMLKTRRGIKKKIINILVECLQNSFHYSLENQDVEPLISSPFLVIVKEEECYMVFAGNHVTKDRAGFLKTRLDEIKSLSDTELREYYMKGLNKEELPVNGGAGLGLMDIARRAGRKIDFELTEIEDEYLFFALQIEVKY